MASQSSNPQPVDIEMKKVPEMLRDAAAIYEERNKLYGDNYKRFGYIMAELFPQGLMLRGPDDFNRFGIFVQMVSKLTRYSENLARGGHADSLDDLAVYTMMLQELDNLSRRKRENEAVAQVNKERGK
jgi:hypothetical protein